MPESNGLTKKRRKANQLKWKGNNRGEKYNSFIFKSKKMLMQGNLIKKIKKSIKKIVGKKN